MPTYNPRQFSAPDKIREISHHLLIELLLPHKKYLASRNITLPTNPTPENIDYDALANVFMTPNGNEGELSETLYYISEMSSPEIADELMEELQAKNIEFRDKANQPTPADIAVKLWLSDPQLLERKHAEQQLTHQRSFEHYQTDIDPVPEFKMPKTFTALEKDLDNWFEEKKRGRGAKVFGFKKPQGFWFMVRHGEIYSRQGTQKDDGNAGSVYFRPSKHDVLFYDAALGELSIHAAHVGEIELYRKKFGLHVFKNENFFPGSDKYTLDPLKDNGKDALACDDIRGMEWIRLKEIRYFWGGPQREVEIRTATDLFAAWEGKNRSIPESARIIRASFLAKFTDAKIPRTVVIQPANIAKYTRDDDAVVVEEFLTKRGFIKTEANKKDKKREKSVTSVANS